MFTTAKCIDHYTKLRVENAELSEDEEKKSIDPRLEGIVNKMFLRCLDDHKYKQAIGIALETRRLDMFEKTILESVSIFNHSLLCLTKISLHIIYGFLMLCSRMHRITKLKSLNKLDKISFWFTRLVPISI